MLSYRSFARDGKGVDPNGKGCEEKLGGAEGKETIIMIYCVGEKLFSIIEINKVKFNFLHG